MSIIIPSNLWLATVSKSGFKEELLKPIKNYKIIAYPDKSEFNSWNKRAEELIKKGYRIRCSNLLENLTVDNGYDLADYLMKRTA